MTILYEWYCNELPLPGYLTVSFKSLPLIANYINKAGCIFFLIANDKIQTRMNLIFVLILNCFYVETDTKRKQKEFNFRSYAFNEIVC